MIRVLEDGRIVKMGQKKSDSSIKVAYVSKKGESFKMVYTGDFKGLMKWFEHQKKLAGKCVGRQLISDICGTSYSAACRDMGI